MNPYGDHLHLEKLDQPIDEAEFKKRVESVSKTYLRVKLYCWKCGYIDYGSGKPYTAYSVNLAAFSRIKCRNCKKNDWRLDVYMEEA